ncbi:MAG: citramalate synthase, partial [Lentisphaeria bacterium]|nr:citramalate synthase [Lentisphaeria bacterium]
MAPKVHIYDTTLRDGTQAEGISFSVTDKVRIAEQLDAFGIDYIEGGWPGSNPRDMGFFEAMRGRKLAHAKLTAFGSTRRNTHRAEEDPNLLRLLEAETPAVAIFGKSWLLHVHDVLRVSPEDNLRMIADSCRFLADQGREVIFDAEHFLDGYLDQPDYALEVLKTAAANGASCIVLCDTNGGRLPQEVSEIARAVRAALPAAAELGIHCHNDSGCGVANSLAAVLAGATHVQGTINGFGERCGNADLCSIIPGLQLKMGRSCVPETSMSHLRELSRFVCDLANVRENIRLPYVGQAAFAHKGGMHVNAVAKNAVTFEHIPPETVGNRRRVLVSDLSGGSNILFKAEEHHISLDGKGEEVRQILDELKRLEAEGYEYESADASFKVLMNKLLKQHRNFFDLEGFRVIIEKRGPDVPCLSEATIKVKVGGETEIAAAEGDGPVNALDIALRKVLKRFYPEVEAMSLRDFKVR